MTWALIIALTGIVFTFSLGDKCLLFMLGARELTQKEKKITSLVNNHGCLSLYSPIKIYSFHHPDLKVCYVRSLVGQGSLIISNSFLNHSSSVEILEEIIKNTNLNNTQARDVAIMLSYQVMVIGYVLSPVSKILSSLVFYLLYPIIQMRSLLINTKLSIGRGKIVHVSKQEKNSAKIKKISTDIINDFSILDRSNDNLINYSLGINSKRASIG